MSIEQVSLVTVIDDFLRKDFSFDQGHDLLGPARKEVAGTILVSPRPGSNVESAALETVAVGPNKPPFLAGMSVTLARPVVVDFADLRRRFGGERGLPLLSPGEDGRYVFGLQGDDYDGSLILDVPGDSSASMRKVNSQILRRFPKGQEP